MTRNRALPGDVPGDLAVAYYGARAAAGMIVTEGTQPSRDGKGYARTPGIHTEEQILGWRRVTEAVHAAGGCIVLQLMHCGRIASHHNKEPEARTVAPSALRAAGKIFTDQAGLVEFDVPEALTLAEVAQVIARVRGRRARRAAAPASTASSCTPPPATCPCSSSRAAPTNGAMPTAVTSRGGCAL